MKCCLCDEPAVSHVQVGGISRALCHSHDAMSSTDAGLTFLTLKLDNNKIASTVAKQTENAYSFDYYTPALWKSFTLYLLNEGYNGDEVNGILRSKHMRWANDQGTENLEDFKEYIAANKESIDSIAGDAG